MNLAEARRPLTFSQKPLRGVVQSFCLTLPDPLCLPSAQVYYIHLFQRCNNDLQINCSFSPLRSIHSLSQSSIHGPNRAIDSSAGRDRIVLECKDEKGRKEGETLKGQEWYRGQHGGRRMRVNGSTFDQL